MGVKAGNQGAGQERPFAHVRQRLGLPLWRAAARLSISERYLRSLELGREPLPWALAQRMATAYEVPVRDLTRLAEPHEKGPAVQGTGGMRGMGKRRASQIS